MCEDGVKCWILNVAVYVYTHTAVVEYVGDCERLKYGFLDVVYLFFNFQATGNYVVSEIFMKTKSAGHYFDYF